MRYLAIALIALAALGCGCITTSKPDGSTVTTFDYITVLNLMRELPEIREQLEVLWGELQQAEEDGEPQAQRDIVLQILDLVNDARMKRLQ